VVILQQNIKYLIEQIPLKKYSVTGEQIENAKKLFVEQAENKYKIDNKINLKEKVPQGVTEGAYAKAEIEVQSFLKARSIDEVDVAVKNLKMVLAP
jgi:hypothetical protein